MKPDRIWILVALLASACNGTEQAASKATPPPAPVATDAPAPAASELPALMTQDEADAKAAAAIQKENADAELEKLKKELGGG